MLRSEPRSRITAKEALSHQWFKENSNIGNNKLNDFGENIKDFSDQAHYDKG